LRQSAGHRQPADTSSNHDRTPTQETAHAATLLQIRDWRITARKPKGLFAALDLANRRSIAIPKSAQLLLTLR
jgi:hypothetical protein